MALNCTALYNLTHAYKKGRSYFNYVSTIISQSVLFMHKSRMTFVDALGDAGGINPITSEPSKIYVIRKGAKPQIYLLNADSPDALLFADRFGLQPRDIVFVSTSRITRWTA